MSCNKDDSEEYKLPLEAIISSNSEVIHFDDNQYVLAWRDEFEGSSISEKNWRYRTDEKVNGNSIKEAVSVSDGVLKIRVVHNNGSYVQDSNGNNTNILSKMPYICGGIISKKETLNMVITKRILKCQHLMVSIPLS